MEPQWTTSSCSLDLSLVTAPLFCLRRKSERQEGGKACQSAIAAAASERLKQCESDAMPELDIACDLHRSKAAIWRRGVGSRRTRTGAG